MAAQSWTGSEAEVVDSVPPSGTEDQGATSDWSVVPKEEAAVSDLADSMGVMVIQDEPDFSPPDESAETAVADPASSEPKEPDVSTTPEATPPTADANDNQSTADPPTTADDPPATDTTANAPPADPSDSTVKKKTLGLSALQPLEALEATEGETSMMPPPLPQCKKAAIQKVAKRSRELLIPAAAPTSGDEQDPIAPLQSFLRGAKSKSAAKPACKRAPSGSASKRAKTQPKPKQRQIGVRIGAVP